MLKKLCVFAASLALFALIAEGALSLLLDTSIRRILFGRTLLERLEQQELATDRESYLAAARTVGPYRVPEDPLVANTLKADAEIEYFEQRIRTDALGLRARPGPPVAREAFHVVVLGDSVAYGHGLAPEECLAAQLEDVLRGALAPGAPEVACSTVAVPGWNYRNSTRHLLDHLDAIAPDLVLFVPVENDLDDSYGVNEAGQRRRAEDPGVPRPLCVVAPPLDAYRTLGLALHGPRGFARRQDDVRIQDWVIAAGLSATSRWRLEDMTATLARAEERLRRVGARLVLAPYVQHDLHRAVRARLSERGVELPVVALLDELRDEDGLPGNPHPNATTTRALALWAASGLAEQGLLPGALARELPDVPGALAGRRGRELSPAELAEWRARFERERAEALVARVAPAELEGLTQVYGGLNADGTLGAEAALLLPPGARVRVELAAAGDSPGLYPLALELAADGAPLGEVALERGATSRVELALPPACAAAPFELRLVARDWTLARVGERLTPSSARLVSVESLP